MWRGARVLVPGAVRVEIGPRALPSSPGSTRRSIKPNNKNFLAFDGCAGRARA
ncbi:hypothetical protein A33M_1412 [Rhodovulum sp. PH10]|nr:hypothetical protein A33M_1412 [Rhodovulum sp. PH10]